MATGISAICILDQKGKAIISRQYRDELPAHFLESFNKKLIEYLDESMMKPLFIDEDNITHLFTRFNDIIFLVVSKRETNVTLVFSFIYKLIEVMEEYFGDLDEEKIRENFVVIYELLDEMIDNGYPQTTEVKMLQEFIKTSDTITGQRSGKPNEKPQLLFGTISWRPEGIKHKENEFYLDVEEKVNMIVRPDGSVLKSEIMGKVRAKSLLSGMPELKLGC